MNALARALEPADPRTSPRLDAILPPPEAILTVSDLRRSYGAVEAVRGVSFALRRATCLGLLGPNGAGKSTIIEVLEGVLPPSSGTIRFEGARLTAAARERMGIVFQLTALQDRLTVRDNLRFFAALYRRRRDLATLARLCLLDDILDRDARRLSGGQRQRLLLAIALVNDPSLIFLDEPTTGLDPQARRAFWDLLGAVKRSGVSIVMSTHYMEEAAVLCDELAIIDRGRIVAQGSPRTLLDRHAAGQVVELPAAALAGIDPASLGPHLLDGDTARLCTSDVEALLVRLLAAGVPLAGLHVRSGTLEDLFILLTGDRAS